LLKKSAELVRDGHVQKEETSPNADFQQWHGGSKKRPRQGAAGGV
jgi:hypothetical protein